MRTRRMKENLLMSSIAFFLLVLLVLVDSSSSLENLGFQTAKEEGQKLLSEKKLGEAKQVLKQALSQWKGKKEEGLLEIASCFEELQEFEEAISVIISLLNKSPSYAPAWDRLANIYKQQEKPEEEISALLRSLELHQQTLPFDSVRRLAELYTSQGSLSQATDLILNLIPSVTNDTQKAIVYRYLAELHFTELSSSNMKDKEKEKEIVENIVLFLREGLRLDPTHNVTFYRFVDFLHALKRTQEAKTVMLDLYKQLKGQESSSSPSSSSLIPILTSSQIQQMSSSFLDLKFHSLLGTLAYELRDIPVMTDMYKYVVSKEPSNSLAHSKLGEAFFESEQWSAAISSFRRAHALDPRLSVPFFGVMFLSRWTCDWDSSMFDIDELPSSSSTSSSPTPTPSGSKIISSFGPLVRIPLGDFGRDDNNPRIAKLVSKMFQLEAESVKAGGFLSFPPPRAYIFPVFNLPDLAQMNVLWTEIAQRLMKQRLPNFTAPLVETKREDVCSKRKLRLGYLGSDFGAPGAVSAMIRGVFKYHNRNRFEVYGFSTSQDVGDQLNGTVKSPWTDIKNSMDHFRDMSGLSEVDSLMTIAKDKVDILIDLVGHATGSKVDWLSLRLAPVQITWLGWPFTTGSKSIDYIIADPTVLTPEQEPFITEQLMIMPNTWIINNHAELHPLVVNSKARKEARQHLRDVKNFTYGDDVFVFTNANQLFKLGPEVFDVWLKILKRVPNSVLWLRHFIGHNSHSAIVKTVNNIVRYAAKQGVGKERFFWSSDIWVREDYFKEIQAADLYLDTFVYTGASTAVDVLWSGVPVLTKLGPKWLSRMSASTVVNLGLSDELVVTTDSEYEERAVFYATHPEEFQLLLRKLEENRLRSPLFDTKLLMQDLERGLEVAWGKYCKGEPPSRIEIPSSSASSLYQEVEEQEAKEEPWDYDLSSPSPPPSSTFASASLTKEQIAGGEGDEGDEGDDWSW